MTSIREDKPAWSAVPRAVREDSERLLGARVVRAVRKYGGYGPSATFHLELADGRDAFFKGVYPLPEGSGVIWRLEEEERVYEQLGSLIKPWAPVYFGSIRQEGWHAVLLEALHGEKVPPWTRSRAERATRSFADFHATTIGRSLPDWLSRDEHLEFAGYWQTITTDPEALDVVVAVCTDPAARREATNWIRDHGATLVAAERALSEDRRTALLHFDTRSDNVRIEGALLRMFDWPFACVGPPEFDFAAYAQSVAAERGPSPEDLTASYSGVVPVDEELLTASVVAIAGFFADRGAREDVPGLPRLRGYQRLQMRSSLAWAARLLELPAPAWLNDVAD